MGLEKNKLFIVLFLLRREKTQQRTFYQFESLKNIF